MQKVTIIIPNYNGKRLLENCLKTLEKQTYKGFKVLVVDNGSTDGSASVKSEVLDMEMVSLTENLGFCGAVNLGIQKTKTPYIILLNNDTEVDEQFVEALLNAIQRSKQIFSCGAQMIDFKNHEILDNAGDLYTALGWAVARGKGKRCADYEKAVRVFSCCAGAAIYRMDVLQRIGGLDEYHFAYLEDVDLGYRARIAGYENWYEPDAMVYHVGSGTSGSRYNQFKIRYSSRNNIYLIYKNMPVLQIIINLPFLVAGFGIKILFFTLKGFGREYIAGIKNGFQISKKNHKIPFKFQNLSNYFRIQVELWVNIFRRLCG